MQHVPANLIPIYLYLQVLQQVRDLLDEAAANDRSESQRHNSLGLRPSTWQRATKMINYHPYHPTTVPRLLPGDAEVRFLLYVRVVIS